PGPGDDCADGAGVIDCSGYCIDVWYEDNWVGDNWCDSYFNCEEFDYDGGDCGRDGGDIAESKTFSKDHQMYLNKTDSNSRIDGWCAEYSGPDVDCAGDCFGDALADDCDVCSGGNSGHDANSDQDECGVCFGDGVDYDDDGICDDVDPCVGFYDCNGTCADLYYEGWIDDGYCDATDYSDNSPGYGLNFLCEEFGWDGGDCDSYLDCADEYFGDAVVDCNDVCDGDATTDSCGVCDSDSTNDNTCVEVGCPDGYIADCSGEMECAPDYYLGDGWCDGEDQQWGYDLSCYDNDGGDCEDPPGPGDDCADGAGVIDCSGNCIDVWYEDNWIGDNWCDSYFNCEEFDYDG
ncbi:uncharacterized protein METZ01_LOCUS262923, partial [marine metagenome]